GLSVVSHHAQRDTHNKRRRPNAFAPVTSFPSFSPVVNHISGDGVNMRKRRERSADTHTMAAGVGALTCQGGVGSLAGSKMRSRSRWWAPPLMPLTRIPRCSITMPTANEGQPDQRCSSMRTKNNCNSPPTYHRGRAGHPLERTELDIFNKEIVQTDEARRGSMSHCRVRHRYSGVDTMADESPQTPHTPSPAADPQSIEGLFLQALGQSPQDRQNFLDEACGDDTDRR